MATKIIEAQLVLSAQDKASAEIAKVVKSFQEAAKATDFSDKVAKLAKAYADVEKQQKAVSAVMAARGPLEATVKTLAAVEKEAGRLAKEYDTARRAAEEFGKVKAFAKGSEQAAQAAKLAGEVKRIGDAHRAAEREVRQFNGAFAAQTSMLRSAEAAASKLGLDLSTVARQEALIAKNADAAAAALKRQMAVDDYAGKAAVVRGERAQARKALVSGGALVVGNKISQTAHAAEHSYAEFDMEIRRQVAMAGLTKDERQSRIDQAVRLGGASTFNDIQVLHAQRTLAGRGVKKELVEPFIEEIVNYAQAMAVDLPSAAKTLEGIVFSTNQHVDDAATARKVMRRNVDLAVKTAKIGGLEDHDIQAAFKMGGATGIGAGLSLETMDTLFALMRKSGYSGEEAGTAARGISSKLIAPSKQGLMALDAMGVPYQQYVRMPDALNADRLGGSVKRTLGKDLSAEQMKRLGEVLENPDDVLDRDKFTADATSIIGEGFDKNKRGELKAADAHAIAKVVGDFYKLAAESVDTEGLLRAVINAHPTQAQLNALVTREHGGKLGSIAQRPELYDEYHKKIVDTPEGFAKSIGDAVMGGWFGATKRVENTKLNVETSMGRSLDNNGEGGGLLTRAASAIADFQQHIAELDPKLVAVGTTVAVVGGKIAEAAGTLGLMGSALALTKSAASLELAAAKLAAGGALPDNVKKGSKLGGFVKGAAGMFGIGALGELAQEYKVLAMPDLGKDGLGRSALNVLDPKFGNIFLGDRAKAMPSMTLAPGSMPLTIQGTGLSGFGLSGPVNPETAGKEAGEKVGGGVIDGIKAKAPEVLEQGRQLFEGFVKLFGQGIEMPIRFTPGEGGSGGGGGIQKASFGGGDDLGGMIRRGSPDGAGHRARAGGSGSGGGGSAGGGTMPAIPGSVEMTDAERNALGLIMKYESHGGNTLNYVGRRQGISPLAAKGYTAQGYFQILNSNWRRLAPRLGITAPNAMSGSLEEQTRVALALLRGAGGKPSDWAPFNPALRGALRRGERAPSGVMARDAAALDPHLVRGLDGKEGLDLGNGTMRMPDGSIRSITQGGGSPPMPERTVPDAPKAGLGGRVDMGEHVAELGRHIDRLSDATIRSHHTVEVNPGPGLTAKTKRMRIQTDGPVRGNVGVSMPQTEIG